MNLAGLAADSGPPLEAPLGLFYLMPVFLGLAGVVLALLGDQVLASRWSPAALAATHFIVLGALAPVMCGALLQIAPVLLGAPYPRVRLVAGLTGAGLALGSIAIGSGFLARMPTLLVGGGVLVGLGLSVFLLASFRALRTAAVAKRATLWTVRLAIVALAVAMILGLLLASVRQAWIELPQHPYWVDAHVAWGLAGWIGLLSFGIGMQLIPLFYTTPPFAPMVQRALPVVVVCTLTLMLIPGLLPHAAGVPRQWFVGILFATYPAYAVAALWHEQRRQRPRHDANLYLWQASHISLLAATAFWLCDGPSSVLGMLLLGTVTSFIVGALLKIVPFLSWLDLQQRLVSGRYKGFRLPRLNELLSESRSNAIAVTLVTVLLLLSLAALQPLLVHLAGLLLVMLALLLGAALAHSVRVRQGALQRMRQATGPG